MSIDNRYPKLLVISNNSLSDNNSNGRTLAGLLRKYPKELIAQIYVTSEKPTSTVCDRFFQMTDKEALVGIIKRNSIGGIVDNANTESSKAEPNTVRRTNKTILKMIIRDAVWAITPWFSKKLKSWLDEYKPEVILFFAGESCFTFKFVEKISKRYNIPIVVYCSEGYYFKDKNYLKKSVLSDALYPLFHKNYVRVYGKLMKKAKHVIYLNEKLQKDYNREFNIDSTVIYTATTVEPKVKNCNNSDRIKISYLGNLGINRHKSLIDIGNALQAIDSNLVLDIYGKIPNKNVQDDFSSCKGIDYKGFVGYDDVIKIMHSSDILIHTESFDEFYKWDLQYGFSTKIADCLASGVCLFTYSPDNISFVDYLSKNDCACVVTNQANLMPELKNIIQRADIREKYEENALRIVRLNHDVSKNCSKMNEIIISAFAKGK